MNTVALIVTIIVALFLVFCLFNGYRKGFLRIVLTTLALVLTIVLAGILATPFTKWIKTTFIGTSVERSVEKYVDKKIDDSTAAIIDRVSEAQTKVIDALPLPKFLRDDIEEKNVDSQYRLMGVNNFKDYLSTRLSDMLIKAISYIILMVLIYIIIRIILRVIGVIGRIPILRGINRLLGALLCLVEGVLVIYILCILVTAISGTSWGQSVVNVINQSKFLQFFYNKNLLMEVLQSVFKGA